MAEIDITKLTPAEAYRFLIGAVLPRPIAWVSTISKEGLVNLAPFSFFNAICSNPPSLLFCPVHHPSGVEKDTLRNIRETRQFVVNVVSEACSTAMNQTSGDYPPEINEFRVSGVTEQPSIRVRPPRVKESPVQFECELLQIVDVGPAGAAGAGSVVMGKIVYLHVSDEVYVDGRIMIDRLQPIARLSGQSYCRVTDIFEMARPKVEWRS